MNDDLDKAKQVLVEKLTSAGVRVLPTLGGKLVQAVIMTGMLFLIAETERLKRERLEREARISKGFTPTH